MKSIPLLSSMILTVAGFALIGFQPVRAADEIDAATKAKIAEFDKGPTKIDVSTYPAGIQKNYEVFRERCVLCHTIARPINSDFALPGEWSRYVKRMMHKPGSKISDANAKKIYQFLAYDSMVRKKALFDAKLVQATPEEKAETDAKIKELLATYPQK